MRHRQMQRSSCSEDVGSYHEAMKGPERDFWLDAVQNEMHSLQKHDVYREVPEDSLDTWNPAKGKAGEVVDVMLSLIHI